MGYISIFLIYSILEFVSINDKLILIKKKYTLQN